MFKSFIPAIRYAIYDLYVLENPLKVLFEKFGSVETDVSIWVLLNIDPAWASLSVGNVKFRKGVYVIPILDAAVLVGV